MLAQPAAKPALLGGTDRRDEDRVVAREGADDFRPVDVVERHGDSLRRADHGGDHEQVRPRGTNLAHEIGHVDLQHSLRQLYRAVGTVGLIMLVAGDIGSGAQDGLVDGSVLLVLSYSRAAEAAADRHSVELMSRAGYDPTAIARFFTLIEEKLGDQSETSMLSTHPGTPSRRKAILDYAATLKGQPAS